MAGLKFPKPEKGTAAKVKRSTRRGVDVSERREKAKVRARDGRCRWPHLLGPCRSSRLEVAHLRAKGMGGDHGLRSTADQMILLCATMHQGPRSLHSGDARVVPVTTQGTNGPCKFQVRAGNGWVTLYQEPSSDTGAPLRPWAGGVR